MDRFEEILWLVAFVASTFGLLKLSGYWQEVEALRRDAEVFRYLGWETSKLEELKNKYLELVAQPNTKSSYVRSLAAINAALALKGRPVPSRATLRVLNDLCYVIECAAMDHMGEGKFELSRLIDSLEGESVECDIPDRRVVAAKLRECLALYRSGDRYGSFSRLTQLSRGLWMAAEEVA